MKSFSMTLTVREWRLVAVGLATGHFAPAVTKEERNALAMRIAEETWPSLFDTDLGKPVGMPDPLSEALNMGDGVYRP